MKAFTLFTLKSEKKIEDYLKWSLAEVHPRMLLMPAVLAFRDYEVVGAMGGVNPPYQLVEEIEITSPEEFERDNAIGDAALLAEEWGSWVENAVVIFCRENNA